MSGAESKGTPLKTTYRWIDSAWNPSSRCNTILSTHSSRDRQITILWLVRINQRSIILYCTFC